MQKGISDKFSRARFLYPDLTLQRQRDEEERVGISHPEQTEKAEVNRE